MSRILSRLPVTPPTLADVAERAGVSRQTVSNAVNNPELLRDDTLQRVQEAIAELGYLPNRAARNLRTRSSHLIGLPIKAVEEGTANAQMDRFVHSLVEASSAAGYHVLLFTGTQTGDPEDELPGYDDLLRSTAVDAFVVTDTYLGNPQADWLNERRAPFVAFGRPWNDPEARHPWVDVDGAAGTELAHHAPHRQGPRADRLDRLAQGVAARRGPAGRLVAGAAVARHAHDRAGLARRGHRRVGSRGQRASCSTRRAPRRSSAPPTPWRWACCTPSPSAVCAPGPTSRSPASTTRRSPRCVPPGLTSVRQPLEDVAVEVVKALANLLGPPTSEPRGVLLTPTLVVRGSQLTPNPPAGSGSAADRDLRTASTTG